MGKLLDLRPALAASTRDKLYGVLPGGGTQTVSCAAGWRALEEEHGFKPENLDGIVSASGNAPNSAYMVSGQMDAFKQIWLGPVAEIITTVGKLWKRSGKIVDIDHLVDEIFKKDFPLDIEAIKRSPIDLYVAATDLVNGHVHHFSNRDEDYEREAYEIIRASAALRFVYRKVVKVSGRRYVDTHISSRAALNIAKAIREGATKIIVMDVGDPDPISTALMKLWVATRFVEFRSEYKRQLAQADAIRKKINGHERLELTIDEGTPDEHTADILYLRPKTRLAGTIMSGDPQILSRNWDQGYEDIKNSDGVKAFLDDLGKPSTARTL